jgi:hypothetical protein
VDLAVIKDTYVSGYNISEPKTLYALAKLRKIDVKKERAAFDAEQKEAAKAKKAKAKK